MSHYSEKHYAPDDLYENTYYRLFFKEGEKVLDVGCSTGNLLSIDPKNMVGVDVDKDAIEVARKRGLNAVWQKDPMKLPFKDNSFENVHCKHVLEHLPSPFAFTKEIFRVLKPKGRLVLLTDKYAEKFWDDYTHVRPYTKKSLTQLAYDVGFRSFTIYSAPSRGVPGLGLLLGKKVISPTTAKAIFKLYANVVEGQSIVIEARK